MAGILQKIIESPSIAKFEVVEDEKGKRTTISMNPRYVFFEKSCNPVEKDGSIELNPLGFQDFQYIMFDLKDPSNNSSKNSKAKVLSYAKTINYTSVPEPVISLNNREPNSLCPVLYNSKHNMIKLTSINFKKVKMPSCSFIDYISIMQFKDGTNYINVNHTIIAYNEKTEKLFWHTNDRYSLKLRGDKGKTSLVKNGRLCMTYQDINNFFTIIKKSNIFRTPDGNHPEYAVFYNLFKELFFTDMKGSTYEDNKNYFLEESSLLTNLYRVKRNRQLRELPWNEYDLAQIYGLPITSRFINDMGKDDNDELRLMQNTRNNINRHIRNNNTKKATDACFYGFNFPKSFRKLLLKTKPMQFDRVTYEYLYKIIQDKGVNKALQYFSIDGKPDLRVIEQTYTLEAIVIGFNANKIMKEVKKEDNYGALNIIRDTLSMRKELLNSDIKIPFEEKDIFKYHDLISHLYTAVKQATESAELQLFRTVDTSNQLPKLVSGEYTIRSPKNAYELIEIGSQMNHCVGSYMSRYFYRRLEIAVVEKDGKYIVCLEIIRNAIVQAKMSNNRRLLEDKELLKLVTDWAKENKIVIGTSDCGAKQKSTSPKPPCKERLKLAKESALKNDVDLTNIQNSNLDDAQDEELEGNFVYDFDIAV